MLLKFGFNTYLALLSILYLSDQWEILFGMDRESSPEDFNAWASRRNWLPGSLHPDVQSKSLSMAWRHGHEDHPAPTESVLESVQHRGHHGEKYSLSEFPSEKILAFPTIVGSQILIFRSPAFKGILKRRCLMLLVLFSSSGKAWRGMHEMSFFGRHP